jgi:hypothetical protein
VCLNLPCQQVLDTPHGALAHKVFQERVHGTTHVQWQQECPSLPFVPSWQYGRGAVQFCATGLLNQMVEGEASVSFLLPVSKYHFLP